MPAGGKAGEGWRPGRRAHAAMAIWQISRQPIRQGAAALPDRLAVATGKMALSQRPDLDIARSRQGRVSTGSGRCASRRQHHLGGRQAPDLARALGPAGHEVAPSTDGHRRQSTRPVGSGQGREPLTRCQAATSRRCPSDELLTRSGTVRKQQGVHPAGRAPGSDSPPGEARLRCALGAAAVTVSVEGRRQRRLHG